MGQLTAPFRAGGLGKEEGDKAGAWAAWPPRGGSSSPEDTHHHENIFLAYVGHHPLGDALERALRQ